MGTNDDFFNCELFVKTLQDKQGLLICSPHEISYRNNWITKENLSKNLKGNKDSEYSQNLFKYIDSI
jgi:glucose-1-phosphate thymidylyltransferase